MKVYEFGDKNKPSIMLFPGTCCYWKTNFGHVLDGLQEHFHTLVVSYSGFDDTETYRSWDHRFQRHGSGAKVAGKA